MQQPRPLQMHLQGDFYHHHQQQHFLASAAQQQYDEPPLQQQYAFAAPQQQQHYVAPAARYSGPGVEQQLQQQAGAHTLPLAFLQQAAAAAGPAAALPQAPPWPAMVHLGSSAKLEADLPPGGPAELLLRQAVRMCCLQPGQLEVTGGELGKALKELDRWAGGTGESVGCLRLWGCRMGSPGTCSCHPAHWGLPPCALLCRRSNWRAHCGGYSVTVLIKELDRRGLVWAHMRRRPAGDGLEAVFVNRAC